MSKKAALVTGFEPFGGWNHNSSAEIALGLDGTSISGVDVVGRQLPVDLSRLDESLREALSDIEPVAVILLGQASGEACIRLERVALNLADFPIPDNAGLKASEQPLAADGDAALWSRLPLREIQTALLEAGIPARLSETAGTYLCNAAMYRALSWLPRSVPCGFIHLPLTPAQVASAISAGGLPQPSMDSALQLRAIQLALEITIGAGQ